MLRLSLFATLLLAVTVPSQAQRSNATHTLQIEYSEQRGDLRAATLSIAPAHDGMAPLRRGDVDQMAVLSTAGQWIVLDRILSSGFGSEARARLPGPRSILMILVKPERGPWRGWRVHDARPSAEWSYVDQRGRAARAPCAPQTCLGNVIDAFDQVRSTRSSFRMDIRGFSWGMSEASDK
ncbi:hypothetical protein [Rubrivirga sp.]|uniref:hypothetical protein n=1 Tax=Rubrivirga sp. TaxID=1885344 RepID=UPI003C778EDF